MNNRSINNPGVLADIRGKTGLMLDPDSTRQVSGGSINRCYQIRDSGNEQYFIKLNHSRCHDMFEAECDGLQELDNAAAIRVPGPITCGISGPDAYLLLEYLPLGAADGASAGQLGTALAKQHQHTRKQFGWHRDNTIGSTPQSNQLTDNWCDFFSRQRLGYQLGLAQQNGYGDKLQDQGHTLLERLPAYFENHHPEASLLHGDLWGGNWGATTSHQAVAFDPAVYYGDRETDIAMTRLFGGFGPEFYRAYDDAYPLAAGFEQRQELYNLYHVLNHLNLFGESYLQQSVNMISRLGAAI